MSAARSKPDRPQTKKPQRQPAEPRRRDLAEWVSLAVSLAIVVGIAGLVVYAHLARPNQPAVIQVAPRLGEVREAEGRYYLPVEVSNAGGQTVESLEVGLTLAGAGEPETAQISIPFLAHRETIKTVVAFTRSPAEGELAVTLSYLEP